MDAEAPAQMALAELAVESWRFARDYRRIVAKLDANEQARFANKLRYYEQRLHACLEAGGLKLISLEGQPFEIGMAAQALNLDEFSPAERLIVAQMLEPVIMGTGGIIRMGKLMVRKAAG
jgi:hypothetical protein